MLVQWRFTQSRMHAVLQQQHTLSSDACVAGCAWRLCEGNGRDFRPWLAQGGYTAINCLLQSNLRLEKYRNCTNCSVRSSSSV